MEHEFPGAVPEMPVSDVDTDAAYYKNQLGFSIDWGSEDGGIEANSGSTSSIVGMKDLYCEDLKREFCRCRPPRSRGGLLLCNKDPQGCLIPKTIWTPIGHLEKVIRCMRRAKSLMRRALWWSSGDSNPGP